MIRDADAARMLPLTPVVVHILLALADGDRHGYAIAQEVEALSEGSVRMGPGTLYGSLQRLVSGGLIVEAPRANRRAAADGDERRRYYRLTPLGRRVIELETQRLARVLGTARARQLLPRAEAT